MIYVFFAIFIVGVGTLMLAFEYVTWRRRLERREAEDALYHARLDAASRDHPPVDREGRLTDGGWYYRIHKYGHRPTVGGSCILPDGTLLLDETQP